MDRIHSGHRDRMREKIEELGVDSLKEHEILEYVLYSVIPRRDTNPIAHELIDSFGSLSGVFEADIEDLIKVDGVGLKTASFLSMIPEITRAYMLSRWGKKPTLESRSRLFEYGKALFAGRLYETYMIAILDNSYRLIYSGVITTGTQTETSAYPGLVMEKVVKHKAQNIVLFHNHLGGRLAPSAEDREITDTVADLLKPMGVGFIDHIIVCGEECYSMSKNNQIKK